MTIKLRIAGVLLVSAMTVIVAKPRQASARTRLRDICTINGQQEVKLTGLGLVVGLNGTGDGGKNLPAMRALASALKLMNNPITGFDELKDAKNVAIVFVESTIPATGLRRGQKVDCYVSSPFGAKSLRGGRLLVTPVETAEIANDIAVGLASGPVIIEDSEHLTAGKIHKGILLREDFRPSYFEIDKDRGHVITLLLDASHASFNTSSEVARAINLEFEFDARKQQLAHPAEPGVIDMKIPPQYHDSPVEFIAQILEVGIEEPHTQARVVVNAKSKVVIVTGEVEISPVIISHKNLTVEVGGGPTARGGNAGGRFVPLNESRGRQTPQQLKDLVDALNGLRVPTADIISIIRELHRSGKLHAVYDEH